MSHVPLEKQRVRVRPTPLGAKSLAFLAALTVAFYVSPYTNLFFLLLTFLVTLLATNVWWTVQNLRGVEARLIDPGPVPAGTSIPVEVAARAPTGGARMQIDVRVRLPKHVIVEERAPSDEPWWARPMVRLGGVPRTRSAATIRFLASDEQHAAGRLPACARGIHQLESLTVSTVFPLGLVRVSRTIEGPTHMVVHPTPAECGGTNRDGTAGDEGGDEAWLAQLDKALGTDRSPAGLRVFVDGDAMSTVDWRASARRHELIVREYEYERTRTLEVVFDRRCDEPAFEASLSLLTAIALRQSARKEGITVHSQGLSATFGEDGGTPMRELLAWLADCKRRGADSGAPTAKAAPGAIQLPRPVVA